MATKAIRQSGSRLDQKFQVDVNRKPVDVDGPLTTGLAIKEAAIEQGSAHWAGLPIGEG